MNLPSLPTDNLYKFISLSGLVVTLFSLYFMLTNDFAVQKERLTINGEITKLQLESNQLTLEQKKLKRSIEDFYSLAHLKSPIIVTDTLIIYSTLTSGPPDLLKESDQLSQLVYEYNLDQKEFESKATDIETKKRILKLSEDLSSDTLHFIAGIFGGIGLSLSIVGFSLWYAKVQKYQDAILSSEYYKTEPNDRPCQSCGIKISEDKLLGGTEKDGKKSLEYCSNCYQNGEFTEPDLTRRKMVKKVNGRMKQLKVSIITRLIHISRLSSYKRWRNELKW